MSTKSLEKRISQEIRQGEYNRYKQLLHLIVKVHRDTFTEENLPTAEDAILEGVNEALDNMWKKEGVQRNMTVYKSFIEPRETTCTDLILIS
jgi:hypothetical protein